MKSCFIAIFLLIICGIAKAEKSVTFTDVDQVVGRLFLDTPVQVGTITYHAPLSIRVSARATTNGSTIIKSSTSIWGTLREEPYTHKESYNEMNAKIKAVYKDLWLEIINVDLDQ